MVSESFDVGLRQGYVLPPVLFSLYINSLVDRISKEAGLGLNVETREYQLCCMLMTWSYWYIDDEKMLRRALSGMGEWCVEWSVKVYVDKCGIMHVRKKGVKRAEVCHKWKVDAECV